MSTSGWVTGSMWRAPETIATRVSGIRFAILSLISGVDPGSSSPVIAKVGELIAFSFDSSSRSPAAKTVSYTHLTLPTNREV